MRLVVIGTHGQLAKCLLSRGPIFGVQTIAIGRPKLNLADFDNVSAQISAAKPDIVVYAAAYNFVDLAEETPDDANFVNAEGAKNVAVAAANLNIPIIHISTDYVFDGEKTLPYIETDAPAPIGAYGRSKLLGEDLVAQANKNHVILRTSWLFSQFGNNFLKTMLELAKNGKSELSIVKDQFGAPTSAIDLADAIFEVARNLIGAPDDSELRGVFHASGYGSVSRAQYVRFIFACAKKIGMPFCKVLPITSDAFPTTAKRPKYSVLDSTKLLNVHGVAMGRWQDGVKIIMNKLRQAEASDAK